jgi:hypothetical protein
MPSWINDPSQIHNTGVPSEDFISYRLRNIVLNRSQCLHKKPLKILFYFDGIEMSGFEPIELT